MRQHKFELQTPTFLQWNTASRIHPDDLKGLACLYCVMCGVISYHMSCLPLRNIHRLISQQSGQVSGRGGVWGDGIWYHTTHNIRGISKPFFALAELSCAGLRWGWAGQTGWELWNGACVWMIQCLDSGMWVSHMEQPVNITIPCWWNHILLIQINQLESVSVQMVLIQPCFNLWF